jgi:outer membrane protein assembly factor BamB
MSQRPPTLIVFAVLVLCAGPVAVRAAEAPPAKAPAFDTVCFDDFYEQQGWPTEAALRDILAEVPGGESRIEKARRHDQDICRLHGLWRLKTAWPADSALRLSLADPRGLRIHVSDGSGGVTLRFFQDFHKVWAAYATVCEEGKPRPTELALLAADGGRYRAMGVGTVELHYGQGQLVLTRGNVRLLSAPLAAPPREVLLDGSAFVRGLAFFAVQGVPPNPHPGWAVRKPLKAAELSWGAIPSPNGFSLTKTGEGAVELAAAERTSNVEAAAAVCRPGLHEFLFEVEDPQPGTGVFLADDAGKPLGRLAFFRDRKTGRTAFGMARPEAREIDRDYDDQVRPVPLAGPRQWFRLAAGAGIVKLWTSGDGAEWSQVEPVVQELTGACTQVGLFCDGGDRARSIRLRRVEVRRLETLHSLVPEAIGRRLDAPAGKADGLAKADNVEEWQRRVARMQPPDVAADVWRRACTLRTLADGAPAWWAQPLLESLLCDALAETEDVAFGLQLLDEAALICNGADWAAADRWAAHVEQLSRLLEHQGSRDPFPAFAHRIVYSPFWAERELPAVAERLLWYDLARRIGENRWDDAAALCRRLRYRGRPNLLERQPSPWSSSLEHLVRCVEQRASQRQAALAPDRPIRTEQDYRHPLIEHWSKEGYNVQKEFQAALEVQAYREACQVITAAGRAAMEGLLPDGHDPRLLVSLPGVIELAMDERPELRRAMQERFGALGQLRLKQAIAVGDAAAVEAIAAQFCGSEAAGEAHGWLGDRHMAAGRLAEAAGEYQRGLRGAAQAQRGGLIARTQLACAMRGEPRDGPINEPVTIGGRKFSAAEFGQLVDEMARSRVRLSRPRTVAMAGRCPAPGPCEVRPWGVVESAGSKKPDNWSTAEIDWPARETAAIVAGETMIVGSRSEQVAFDLATGKKLWQYQRQVVSASRPWPLVAVRPVPGPDRIYIRRSGEVKPELACVDGIDGRLLWSSAPAEYVASDPLVTAQGVWALCASRTEGQKIAVLLTRFDPASGGPLSSVPLVEFQGFLDSVVPAQAAVLDDKIVATVGGTVLCCDLSGRVRWLRRQAWVAPPGSSFYDSRAWLQQRHAPPLVVGSRVYATQPGTWSVECLDLQTGRLVWQSTLSELVGLAGLIRQRLIVETTDGLAGLDPLSGKVLWHHDARDRLEGQLCGPPGGLLYVQTRPDADTTRKEPRITLVWVDPATGRAVQRSVLESPRPAKPLVGPLVTDGNRLWGLFGAADDTARREILEIVVGKGGLARSRL